MLATIIQAVGVAVTSIGIGLWFPPAGIIAGGIGMVLFGIAMERGK
jgi:hypothetical protein